MRIAAVLFVVSACVIGWPPRAAAQPASQPATVSFSGYIQPPEPVFHHKEVDADPCDDIDDPSEEPLIDDLSASLNISSDEESCEDEEEQDQDLSGNDKETVADADAGAKDGAKSTKLHVTPAEAAAETPMERYRRIMAVIEARRAAVKDHHNSLIANARQAGLERRAQL